MFGRDPADNLPRGAYAEDREVISIHEPSNPGTWSWRIRHQPHDVVPRDQLRVRELLRVERIHPRRLRTTR